MGQDSWISTLCTDQADSMLLLSRSPQSDLPSLGEGENETQVSAVTSADQSAGDSDDSQSDTIGRLLRQPALTSSQVDFAGEQRRDPAVAEIIPFLTMGELPQEERCARKMALQKSLFVLEEGLRPKAGTQAESCSTSPSAPADSARTPFKTGWRSLCCQEDLRSPHLSLVVGWHVYTMTPSNILPTVPNVPLSLEATPLHPITVSHPFQIIGVDIMELPITD